MSMTTQSDGLLAFIERAARDPSFDVAKMEALLRLRREERQEMARQEYFVAMSRCQAVMEPVIRGKANPGTQSRYARLEDIDGQMRPIYTAEGFSVTYGSDQAPQPGWIRVTCTVAHVGGHAETHYLDGPTAAVSRAMTQMQGIGSAVTYLRRYLLSLVFNIVQGDIAGEDMDGEEGRREDMRAAAAALDMKRGPRVTDKAAAEYEAPPKSTLATKPIVPRTGEQWNVWMDGFEMVCGGLDSRKELDDIVWKPGVVAAKKAAPPNVLRDIEAILAAAYERLPATPIDPDLSDEALGEVAIEGADKVAAG